MNKIRVYLSGLNSTLHTHIPGAPWHEYAKIRYRCYNFASLGRIPIKELNAFDKYNHDEFLRLLSSDVGIMMDSGVVTIRNRMAKLRRNGLSLKESTVIPMVTQWYVDFLNKYRKKLDVVVTLDWHAQCPFVYKITTGVEKVYGLKLMPVYHADQSTDWVKRYLDAGHTLLGLAFRYSYLSAGDRRFVYDECFSIAERYKARIHGFAMTNPDYLYEWPWWSVDSTSWILSSVYGQCFVPNARGRLNRINLAARKRNNAHQRRLMVDSARPFIEAAGFNMDLLLRSTPYRMIYNAWALTRLSDFTSGGSKWTPLEKVF